MHLPHNLPLQAADKAIESSIERNINELVPNMSAVGIITKDRGFINVFKNLHTKNVTCFVISLEELGPADPLRFYVNKVVESQEAKDLLKHGGHVVPLSKPVSPQVPKFPEDNDGPGNAFLVTVFPISPGKPPEGCYSSVPRFYEGNDGLVIAVVAPPLPISSDKLPEGYYFGICTSWAKENGGLGIVDLKFNANMARLSFSCIVEFNGCAVHSSRKSNPGTMRSRVAIDKPQLVKLNWRRFAREPRLRVVDVRQPKC